MTDRKAERGARRNKAVEASALRKCVEFQFRDSYRENPDILGTPEQDAEYEALTLSSACEANVMADEKKEHTAHSLASKIVKTLLKAHLAQQKRPLPKEKLSRENKS